MKGKLVVIGLDGATFDVIGPLVEKGKLPNIARLMSGGVYAELESVIPPVTAPAWVSFATGKLPENHGCFFFGLPENSLDDFRPITSDDILGDTFYEVLEGKKVLINLPVTFPPRIGEENVIITSLLTQGKNFVYPKGLKSEFPLLKNYRIIANETLQVKNKIDEYILDIRNLERVRFQCAKEIFLKKDWQFFFVMFSGSDWVQHWRFCELFAGRDPQSEKLFEELDSYIGWFVKNLPKNTNTILMSDHGFRSYKRKFYINKWLEREGFLKTSVGYERAVDRTLKEQMAEIGKSKINIGWFANMFSRIPFLYKVLKPLYIYLIKRIPFLHGEIKIKLDPAKSKARAVWGGIYINDDRFETGIVKDSEKLKKEIIRKLGRLKDPLTGKKVARVWESKSRNKKIPDIIYKTPEHEISYFLVAHDVFDSVESAHHSDKGIFIAAGPDIKKGKLSRASIVDIAPTILHMFGLAVPRDMDGRVLDLFTRRRKVNFGKVMGGGVSEKLKIKDAVKILSK